MEDFNNAGPQRSYDVIPTGTIATLQLKIRSGNAGSDGVLRRSKAGNSEALDCELVVVGGPYAKRKLWSLMTVNGTTDGHAQAADINRQRIRGILESARGIRPDDMSEAAQRARQIASYGDLDGLCFIGRIGIDPEKDGYPAKNILLEAVTPDRKDWHPIEQVAIQANAASTAGKPEAAKQTTRPAWAK